MDKSIGEYFKMYKNLSNEADREINIALLSSFTSKGIKEVISVKCQEVGIKCAFYQGEYNQYSQEILNDKSGFNSFKADLIILFIDTINLMGQRYFDFYDYSEEDRYSFISAKFAEIKNLIEILKKRTKTKILLHNFEVPISSSMGILENKQKNGIHQSIERLNSELRDEYMGDSQILIFDYDGFCSRIGKDRIHDTKMYYLGDLRISLDFIPEICEEYMAYIKPISSIIRKCFVLDLDNTLWGGIVGEVGIEKIALGPTSEGRPFMELQQYILSLNKRGVLLAINSKNNLDDALKVIREHPYMFLREDNFAAIEINWDDKVSNLRRIAQKLNIGLDSIVFMDDDRYNTELVRRELPQVKVVELPEDPALFLRTVMDIKDFNVLQLTYEDIHKQGMYIEQQKREIEKNKSDSLQEYIASLKIEINITINDNFNISRIAQLTQKTNQFNMTTRRYNEEQIKYFMQSSNYFVMSADVKDKFGDNGLTAVIIVIREGETFKIDSFLMSCRIIGRKIEYSLLNYLLEYANKQNCKVIIGEFIESSKNFPSKLFYKDYGFKFYGKKNDIEYWKIEV